MIEYLQKIDGYNLNGLTSQEKYELEHLRVELKKFREIEEQENKEISVSEGSESESEKESGKDKSKEQSEKSSRKESNNENDNENDNDNEKDNESQNKSSQSEDDDEDSLLGDLTKQVAKKKKYYQELVLVLRYMENIIKKKILWLEKYQKLKNRYIELNQVLYIHFYLVI